MSDLQPQGVQIRLGGQEYRLLFSIGAIDQIQAACGLPLPDAIGQVSRAANGDADLDALVAFRAALKALLNEATGDGLTDTDVGDMVPRRIYTAVAWAILSAYMESMPEPDEDEGDDDEEEDGGQDGGDRAVNIARLLYIGCKILNYTEEEVLHMTLRKFYLLYDEHLELNGIRRKEDESLLDAF